MFYPDEGEADGLVVFDRDEKGVTVSEQYREGLAVSLFTLKDNRLFLSCAANFSQIDVIEKAFLPKQVKIKQSLFEPLMRRSSLCG